jgi:hypothetical protein
MQNQNAFLVPQSYCKNEEVELIFHFIMAAVKMQNLNLFNMSFIHCEKAN